MEGCVTNTTTSRPHRWQWSIQGKRGKESSLERAGQNPDRSSNDNLITELVFTKAFYGLSKDTVPDPEKIKFSDIKNLSVGDKSELFTLYEQSFTTGQVPLDLSHS